MIVSGAAEGIDSAAHRGALDVLGSLFITGFPAGVIVSSVSEELILKAKLSTVDFLSAMTELELLGVVEPLAGKNYKRLK